MKPESNLLPKLWIVPEAISSRLVVAGKHGWNTYTARRAASEARSHAAAVELKALIEGSGANAEADAPPNEPEVDGTAGKGGTGS